MKTHKILLSKKQKQTIDILNDPLVVDLLLGGGAGGSKSITVCIWMLMQIRDYPGIRIGLGRKEITKLKQTTVVTLLREAHQLMGVTAGEFVYQDQKALITYHNGSSIQLVDMVRMPSDPDYDRFGSLNLTHTVIEEAGEIVKKAKDVFTSRKNRFMNKEYGIVGKSVQTCNPSQNFLKNEYYKPYKEKGGGTYQRWKHGHVIVNGERLDAYRGFLQSLANDNPFLPPNYLEVLRMLPTAEKKRLLLGDWDFGDSDKMLFPPTLIDRVMTDEITPGKRSIGVDIADVGNDCTIISMVENGVLVEQEKIEIDKTLAVGDQIADAIIKFAQQRGFSREQANYIAIDSVGVGASTRDFLRTRGWNVREFIAGSSSSSNMYRNLRGETIYTLSRAMDNTNFKIYKHLNGLDELREDLMAHEYETQERVILVKPKKSIKEQLGRSPDRAESAYIAFFASKGDNDPKHNSNRIII